MLYLVELFAALRLAAFLWLHIRFVEFSPLRNTVSDYGARAESRPLYSANAVLSLASYTALLIYLQSGSIEPSWAVSLLAGAIVGSVAILFFPTDESGSASRTTTGRLHWLLATFNFAALFILVVNVRLPGEATSQWLDGVTWLVRVAFYAFLASLVLPKLRRSIMGLTERLFLCSVPIWLIAYCVAIQLG